MRKVFTLIVGLAFAIASSTAFASVGIQEDGVNKGAASVINFAGVSVSGGATKTVTVNDIDSGTIDGAIIGGTTPAAGTFTTLTANTSITLDGSTITSWGSVVTPWTDNGTTTTLNSAPTKFVLTHSTGEVAATKLTAGTGDVALENGQVLDGGTNNKVLITDNSDSMSIELTGDDVSLDATDGGYIFSLTDATNGTVDLMTNNDSDDYIQFSTTTNQPLINFVGCNGKITAATGTIDFDNEILTTTGNATLGSVTFGDDVLDVVTDDELRFASNDDDSTIEAYGFEAKDGVLLLTADESDDNGDEWKIESDQATNSIIFSNDTSGSLVTKLTMATTGAITTTNAVTAVVDDASNTAITNLLVPTHTTSGTPAAGIGTGISLLVEDAGGSEEQASLDAVMTDVTNGTEDCDIVLSQNTAGAIAETLRLVAASSATVSDYLQYTGNTTETNGLVNVLVLKQATGTATDNFGMSVSFQPEDATGSEEHASIDILQTTAARATNDTDIVFSQDVNGTMTERVRMDADGSNLLLSGATPAITIGDAGEEDTQVNFDGQAQDFSIGLDDTDDDLNICVGTTLGTTAAIEITEDARVTITTALNIPLEVVTATNVITANEGGKVFVLNSATEFASTLPTASTASGMVVTFIVGAAPADASYTISTGNTHENLLYGMILEAETDTTEDGPTAQAQDTITLTDGVAVVGDWVRLTCDGTNWYVEGMTAADGGVSFSTT